MKEGRVYKKLGDVCNIYQPHTISAKELDEKGKYVVYGANGIIGKYSKYNHENSEVLMTCRGATCGTINISKPYSWINGNAMVIHPLSNEISQAFLAYSLKGMDLSDVITGAAQPQITRQSLSPKMIYIPSTNIQQLIVEELDLISGIIEKQKYQLNNLDNLAQSIFYEMFGDPITNEKGWIVQKLGKICLLKAGKSIKASELKDKSDSLYPCYGGNGIRGYINKISHKENYPIIGRQGALCGNVNFAKAPFYATEHAVVVSPISKINIMWLFYQLKNLKLEQYAHGVAQPGIAVGDLNLIDCSLPPISLQHQFAERVESIERMKQQVQTAIKDLETLLASRMQYWFD